MEPVLVETMADSLPKDPARRSITPSLAPSLPGELILQVLENLDLTSAVALSSTCKRLHQIYLDNKAFIVFRVLPSDPQFMPTDCLFRVAAISPADLDTPRGHWISKEVRYRHTVLAEHQTPHQPFKDFMAWHSIRGSIGNHTPVHHLQDTDVDRVIDICKAVKGWERIFPHYRFANRPEMVRKLRPHEEPRLRKAIYNWMKYDYHFHGSFRQPARMVPQVLDPRFNTVRFLDWHEFIELGDLWATVRAAVESLCPSLAAVCCDADILSEDQLLNISWGGGMDKQYSRIVSTMLKLGPERLLYYMDHRHEYTKGRLVDEIRREHPDIECEVESLTQALHIVRAERWREHLRDKRGSDGIIDRNVHIPEGSSLDFSGRSLTPSALFSNVVYRVGLVSNMSEDQVLELPGGCLSE